MLRGFEDHGASRRQRRRQLPGRHQKREVPRNNLTNDPDGLAQRVRKILTRHGQRNRRAGQLGRPAGHVTEHVDGERNVGHPGNPDGLAIIERLEFGELFEVGFDQIGQFPKKSAALSRPDLRPRAVVKRPPRSSDRKIDVLAVGLGDFCDHHPGGRVIDRECLVRYGIDELAVDHEFRSTFHKVADRPIESSV